MGDDCRPSRAQNAPSLPQIALPDGRVPERPNGTVSKTVVGVCLPWVQIPQHGTVVVTGVAGFIGSAVARRLVTEGFSVVGVDNLSSGNRRNIPKDISFVEADASRAKLPQLLPRNAKAILHLAGQSSGEISFDDPVADLEKNTVSTLRLLEYARACGIRRFLYASSMAVYGEVPDAPTCEDSPTTPLSCYGIGKLASESYLRVFADSVSSTSLRMFNVYGPGQDLDNLRQGMISIYLAQAHRARHIEVKGEISRFRDFIYIDDVVEAWFRCLTLPECNELTLNIGSGVRTKVSDVLNIISSMLPAVTIKTTSGTPGDQYGIYSDNSRMRAVLRMEQITPLAVGLEKFWQSILETP
ncbi:MAG: NAD-dependent epimerase/dehydratase family protein [Acidimicrobiia bacterium]|nr:NAD-dependent epimerase/dehydratase family protein [Acidimicrobiia bacterium]